MKQSLSIGSEQQVRQSQTTACNRSLTSEMQSFVDNRPQTIAQRQLIHTIHTSPQMIAQRKQAGSIRNSSRIVAQREFSRSLQSPGVQLQAAPEEEMLQGKFETVQRIEEKETLQGKSAAEKIVQREQKSAREPNNTGLSDDLKSSIEHLSGMSMDHNNIHYNSLQPVQLNALTNAQDRRLPMMQMQGIQEIKSDLSVSQDKGNKNVVQRALPPTGFAETKNYYKAQGNAKKLRYLKDRPADFSTAFKKAMVKNEWGGHYNQELDLWHVVTQGQSQVVLPTNAIQIDHKTPWKDIEAELKKDPATALGGNLGNFKQNGYVTDDGKNYTMYAARMYYHDVPNLTPMAGSENASKGANQGGVQSNLELAWKNRVARSSSIHNQMVQSAFTALNDWSSDVPTVTEILSEFDGVDKKLEEAEENFRGI